MRRSRSTGLQRQEEKETQPEEPVYGNRRKRRLSDDEELDEDGWCPNLALGYQRGEWFDRHRAHLERAASVTEAEAALTNAVQVLTETVLTLQERLQNLENRVSSMDPDPWRGLQAIACGL